jgi:hypothetical protein
MKVACLLGVSNYKTINKLPACENDINLINSLLEATGEYDQLLCISGNQESSKVKQQIVSFLTQFKDQQVDQLLFYYTGHGDFDGKEFFYLLSDYESSRQKQTVIENTELDNWIRLLKPALTIKIIDACHAGVQYIKDPNAFEKFLQATPKSFNSCYFLFSSLKEQYSYQNDLLSDFTKSVAESVASFSGTEMRFKDIIDYVSDSFAANATQTPFFITQATNTELFASIDMGLREKVKKYLLSYTAPVDAGKTTTTAAPIPPPKSLVDLVKGDAAKYCTKEEVLKKLDYIQEYFKKATYEGDIGALYSFEATALTSLEGEVPRIASIGKWLSENKNNYFAEPTYRQEEYTEEIEIPKKQRLNRSWVISAAALANYFEPEPEYETKTVKRMRKIETGFRLTQETNASAIRITAKPKLENLSWCDCHLTYVFSKIEIRFFYLFSTFREQNWEKRSRQPEETWRTVFLMFKEDKSIDSALDQVRSEFSNYIMEPIKNRYIPANISSGDKVVAPGQAGQV